MSDDIGVPGSPTPVRINNRNVRYPTRIPTQPVFDPAPPDLNARSPPRKRRIVYGDRYIPNRNGVNLQAAYSLMKDEVGTPTRSGQPGGTEVDYQKVEEANKTFSTLLKAELFADNVPAAVPNPSSGSGFSSRGSPSSGSSGSAAPAANNTAGSGGAAGADMNDAANVSPSGDLTPPRVSHSAPVTPNKNLFRYQARYTTGGVGDSGHRTRTDLLDPQNDIYSISPVRMDSQRLLLTQRRQSRKVSKTPYKVLDAPELEDDFYLNLVDWGSKNVLGVGLRNSVYLWYGTTGNVKKLCELTNNDKVAAVSWIKGGTHLAVGTTNGLVQIWDAEHGKRVRTMTGHDSRANSLAWNEHILTSGSRDKTILHRDVREPQHYIRRLTAHRQEVCGLRWNVDENKLVSGSNDNKAYVWDGLNDSPLYKFEHTAAVKALAWSPHQRGLLATGAGTMDRRIRFWSTLDGSAVGEVDTGSQVCNLVWSKNSNEVVSCHGFSQNQVMVWKYPSMYRVAALTGHTYRVLYLSLSPDGRTIVTGAGDETLRFWNVFNESKPGIRDAGSALDAFQQLR